MSDDAPTGGGSGTGGSTRPTTRSGPGFGSTLSIIVAAVAVVLGFFILRDISSDDDGGGGGGEAATTTAATTETTQAAVTSTTITTTGYTVVVANASGVGGTAKQMTIALQGKGFTVADPTDAAASAGNQTTTVVYYLPGFEAGAQSVAATLGGVQIQPMPNPPPTQSGSLGDASVLVMLGTDLAGKPLPEGSAPTTGTTTTVG
jgi:hypothetical protein